MDRSKNKRILTILSLLFLVVICMVSACGQKPKRTPGEIIEELAVYYGNYGEDAAEKTEELLKELEETDEKAAAQWKKILKYWKYANHDIRINEEVLPDGLPDDDTLCLVALGFKLKDDGSMKEELIERLKVVLASAKKYQNALIVCTGGGTAAGNPEATEAGKMAKWLEKKGIAKERILVEDKSMTTAQNAQNTYDLLRKEQPQVTQIAIISSDYHIATGALFFESCFLLQAEDPEQPEMNVISNAAYHAPKGELTTMFQAGGLIELSGDKETAYDIYYETYDIHELPSLDAE